MWFDERVFYQIYPLGFCGAPTRNDGVPASRIRKVEGWIPYFKQLGIGAVLFNPLFESDAHGYDTRDYNKVDVRLGSGGEFADVCKALKKEDIKIVLDGVFNHVGRGFWAFQDVLANRQNSAYRDWFYIDFGRDSNYGDGLWYEGWEGHFDLVKLNLRNEEVVKHLLDSVGRWIDDYGIDGIRLDVAYCLDHDFIRRLREFTSGKKNEFYLVGEMLHGDYKTIIGPDMLDSATNYECYKGLYSSLNCMNYFEIGHSLSRQFGPEDWTLYKGISLFNFIDNHDVTRAASILSEPALLPLLYGMLFGMPGVPCIYYGSEWGATGEKGNGNDAPLRPSFEKPLENELSKTVQKMCEIRTEYPMLAKSSYRQVYLTNGQFIFERKDENTRFLFAFNAEKEAHVAHFNAEAGMAMDLLKDIKVDFGGGLEMAPQSVMMLKMER